MCWAERFSAQLNPKAWTEIPQPLHYTCSWHWPKDEQKGPSVNSFLSIGTMKNGLFRRHFSNLNGDITSKKKQCILLWTGYPLCNGIIVSSESVFVSGKINKRLYFRSNNTIYIYIYISEAHLIIWFSDFLKQNAFFSEFFPWIKTLFCLELVYGKNY